MAQLDQGKQIQVLDSEGVRGTVTAQALQQSDNTVLITFDDGRRVQAPRAMLLQREDGTYSLPLRLRELSNGTATLQPGGDGNVVAVIPVIAEQALIGKRTVETGRVRIRKTVDTVEEEVDVPLLRETVQVERVPVDRYLDEAAAPEYRGETLVIPVMEEVLVVEKRLLLREEIHVTTVREETRHQETVALQREQVTVTRDEAATDNSAPV